MRKKTSQKDKIQNIAFFLGQQMSFFEPLKKDKTIHLFLVPQKLDLPTPGDFMYCTLLYTVLCTQHTSRF